MSLTLWSGQHHENARSHKILVAAAFANVPVTLKACTYGVENETCTFARNCSPCMRFPSLQTEEGYVFESNAIMRHIARLDKSGNRLYGSTPFESSQVDMWLDFAATEIDASMMPFLMQFFANIPAPADAINRLEESLTGLELWLETRTFLVGERLTIADISIAFSLQWVYRATGDHGEALSKKFRNVFRLYNTVMQQPKTVEVLASQGATFGPVKAAKPAKKAEAAPAKAAKKADADDEPAPPKAPKNPLENLPPSKMVLDEFKREYSNADTRTVAAPWFFDHYDPEGYTCFYVNYKYNEENTRQFMTANLVRGWFQRMEHMRKFAFGVVLLVGEESKHDVVGLWVFRGKGLPVVLEDVADTELYEWTEIKDVMAERAKITDFFCWEGPTISKPVLEGRCFK